MRLPKSAKVGEMVGILLVEDSQMQRMIIDKALGKLGYAVTPAGSGEEALERYQENKFDVLLLDVILPGIDGVEVLRQVRAQDQDQCVILMTAEGSGLSAMGAIRAGADDYVTKPIRLNDGGAELEVIISRSLERRSLARDNRRLQAQLLDAQRVEAVMHLAGAAAHEMNQPLTVIMGMAELLSEGSEPETLREDLAAIRRSAVKLSEIVRKLASITDYKTKAYANNLEILDLDGSVDA
jgi:DNA-binding response OmpR family regulator